MSEQKQQDNEPQNEHKAIVLADNEKLMSVMNLDAKAFGEQLEKMDETIELTADYLALEEGESKKFIFIQKTSFSGDDGEKSAVLLADKEKKTFITASTVIVNTLNSFEPPIAISIANLGAVKMKGGKSYTNYSVRMLR